MASVCCAAHSELEQDKQNNIQSEGVGHNRSMGRLRQALIGGIFVVNSFILRMLLPDQEFMYEASALLGSLILALPIFITAIKDLYHGKVYMNELVALAILAAMSSGNFREAGLISFFLLISIIIESRTASGAQRSIEALVKLTPSTANKIVGNNETEVDVIDLVLGDVVRVRPGDNFPTDGLIISGDSTVNQASITGESLPVDKAENEDVFAGTQNLTGSLEVKVTKVGEDTTLGKVKEMILAAENSGHRVVRIIDKYAGYYTPTIVMLALLTWWLSPVDDAMNRVITLLVISCPCAIVLATPTAILAAVAAAARLGIYIKNVSDLEVAAKVRAFVFDKTGTLTEGQLSVARLSPVEGIEPAELLHVAASVEKHSNHPTAIALQTIAAEADLKLDEIIQFSEVHGKGVRGTMLDSECIVGRQKWVESLGVDTSSIVLEEDDSEQAGMSVVFVARKGVVIGWIGFKDRVRTHSAQIIKDLHKLGINSCSMVTGDRESVATQVAAHLGIEEFRSDCLPETKVEHVEILKKEMTVAVIGDGVNDAPALAAGDLGIAMGAIGSDIAVNSASIALMTNDLRRVPMLITLSRKAVSIINQNLFIGFLFVIGGILLAVFGRMNPILAAVMHLFSTLIILFNSARLVRTGEELTLEGESQ